MKVVTKFCLLALILASSAFGEIQNSSLAPSHERVVEEAVINHCGVFKGYITEVKTNVTTVRVGNGVTDYQYETLLHVHQRVDQMMFDTYEVTVKSSYSDQYDHQNQSWGSYEIQSIGPCIMI